MFYGQCNDCNERWELGTASTCKCPDFWEGYIPEPVKPYKGIADHINQVTNGRMQIDPVTGDVAIGTPSTPAQQEPVAWMDIDEKGAFSGLRYWSEPDNRHEVALYTSPQRTWVGLTDEEIEQGCKESWVTEQAWQSAVWWAEAKLRGKNEDRN